MEEEMSPASNCLLQRSHPTNLPLLVITKGCSIKHVSVRNLRAEVTWVTTAKAKSDSSMYRVAKPMQGHHNHLLQHRFHDRLQSTCSFLSAPSFPLTLNEGEGRASRSLCCPGRRNAAHLSACRTFLSPPLSEKAFPCTSWCLLMEVVLPPCNSPLLSACPNVLHWLCTALWCFPTHPQ